MSRLICMISVADLIACRLSFFMSDLRDCEVVFLCGCCRWYLLLLARWCGGFCDVRVSEA
jgi:hypothetical protein